MKINPDKSEFFRKRVAYLGQLITQDRAKPYPTKIAFIHSFPEPKYLYDNEPFPEVTTTTTYSSQTLENLTTSNDTISNRHKTFIIF